MELTLPEITGPVFFSANFGGGEPRRPLRHTQTGTTVLFTDADGPAQLQGWDHVLRVPHTQLASTPRRAARNIKLQPHNWFPNAAWSVWFDATHDPLVDLATLEDYIQTADVACFRHPSRTCVAAEITECRLLGLDHAELLTQAADWLREIKFPDAHGLYGTACVVRRHNPVTLSLGDLWWWGCNRYTQRDQILFPWATWTLGVVPHCLHGWPRKDQVKGKPSRPNPYFEVTVWD